MEKKNVLTKILTIVGTVFVWFPILAPILASATFFIEVRRLRLDYLMPAELFMFFFVGGGLLIWAALRARLHLKRLGSRNRNRYAVCRTGPRDGHWTGLGCERGDGLENSTRPRLALNLHRSGHRDWRGRNSVMARSVQAHHLGFIAVS
jgi:hypothetical protein